MILNTAPAANTAGIPNLLPDNNPMIGTTPHIPPYMGNPSAVLPQQHHTSIASSSNIPVTAKQSKAIKIVNPDTMKEVDTSKLKKTSHQLWQLNSLKQWNVVWSKVTSQRKKPLWKINLQKKMLQLYPLKWPQLKLLIVALLMDPLLWRTWIEHKVCVCLSVSLHVCV